MNNKMSLVVLRSWTDGPPKVRAIAPPDDDRSLRIEPDHHGRFLTEEISQDDPRYNIVPRQRAASTGAKFNGINHHKIQDSLKNGESETDGNTKKGNKKPLFLRRRIGNGHVERNLVNRHSYSGISVDCGSDEDEIELNESNRNISPNFEGRKLSALKSFSTMNLSTGKVPPSSLSIRPGSALSHSPDGSPSVEYTPPSSPVSGLSNRYRNLGPEISATIPKRTIKSSWISGIKSRWMKSTTHPESSGRSILKSYSSTPSLLTSSSLLTDPNAREDLLNIDIDEISGLGNAIDASNNERNPFFNPLYKLASKPNQHQRNLAQSNFNNQVNHFRNHTTTGSNNSTSSGIALSADDDSDRSRSSLSNPISHSPSPPPNNPINSLRQQIVTNSSKPNGIQKYNSLTDFSEEDLFCGTETGSISSGPSPTGSPYFRVSSGYGEAEDLHSHSPHNNSATSDECVLVEVIRKSETTPDKSDNKFVKGKAEKRFSEGELEFPLVNNKFAGVKVEGSPGKVARIKENIKKFGRFGRTSSEKVLRFRPEEIFSDVKITKITPEKKVQNQDQQKEIQDQSVELKQSIIKENLNANIKDFEEEQEKRPIPTARKRSKNASDFSAPELIEASLNLNQRERNQVEENKTKLSEFEIKASNANLQNNNRVTTNQTKSSTSLKSSKNGGVNNKNDNTNKVQSEVSSDARPNNNSRPDDNDEGVVVTTDEKLLMKSKDTTISDIQAIAYDEPVSSIIEDNDRSISSHLQSIPTIDIQDFPVQYSQKEKFQSNVDDNNSQHIYSTTKNIKANNVDVGSDIINENLNTVETTSKGSAVKFPKISVSPSSNIQRKDSSSDCRKEEDSSRESEMFRRNNFNVNSYANSHVLNGHQTPTNGSNNELHNGNVKAVVNQLQLLAAEESQKIGHGKSSKHSNGMASVQVPVQAINRHVAGYGMTNIYANSIEDDRGSDSPASASSESRSTDFEWHRSSTRASFRGFCEGLLQDEKITIQIPEVVEASISFDNEDSSSIDPDEERENSVEYISIADVKMNPMRKLDKTNSLGDDRDPLPNCVISLDIGSRGSGYSYWMQEENDCVRIGNVDTGSSCPMSHKLPSWVSVDDMYLDVEDDDEDNTNNSTSPAFGYQALNRFLSQHSQSQIFWKWREHFNEGSTFPFTLESKANDEELQLIMKSAIKHYAKIALDQVALKKRDGTVGHTVFVVSIPSSFDQHSRKLLRDAALGSGLIQRKDALALIEDPCAAGIFAYHAIKTKIAKLNNIGTSYLSVDIGGVYLHTSGYEVSDGKLYQMLIPKSEQISESPESLFEAELSSIFTPSFIFNYQNKYKGGWLKLMTEFEHCKNSYDPVQRGNYHVFVPSSFVDQFRRFTSMEVEDALESSDILWSRVGALGIPYWKMQRLLEPMMDFIKTHILNLIKNHNYEFLVITGGRSGSRQLIDYLRNAVRDFSVDVSVPKEYNAAVLQGSTISLTNLAPRLIIKSPFSIGVGVMTPFVEDQHPEEKRVLRDGKSWCADVWDSLIKVGQDLELNKIVFRRSYVGAQPGQSLLILPLFQSPEEPKFVTESSVRKCCEFKFNSVSRAWQEVELVIKCRPSELLIIALDGGIMKNVVVVDFST